MKRPRLIRRRLMLRRQQLEFRARRRARHRAMKYRFTYVADPRERRDLVAVMAASLAQRGRR